MEQPNQQQESASQERQTEFVNKTNDEKPPQVFNKTCDETLIDLGTQKDGLTKEQLQSSQEKYGKNALAEGKKKSALMVFLEQFKDLLVIILIVAAIVSGVTGAWESTIVIIAVILLNAILGTVQHVKAEKSLSSLKAMSAPSAKVRRDGEVKILPSEEVAVGDIVILEAGDLVVADGRILENYNLQINESSLTGESTAVEKHADVIAEKEVALGDRKNMVFSGSLVTYGRAVMAVTNVGMTTEIGKIANLMNATKERKTPLQISLDKFSQVLAIIILGISLLVFGLTLWRSWNPSDMFRTITDSLMFAVALAVAAIPEALASIVTIVQAVGTQKMAKQNAIIKDLKAVESLGAVSVICSDKTGTLTQNKMTAKEVYVGGETVDSKALDLTNEAQTILLHAMIMVNDSTNINGEEIGDPTEIALTNVGKLYNICETEYRASNPRCHEIAFDSDRKLMTILHTYNGKNVMFTKGAYDVLLRRTDSILMSDGLRQITKEDISDIDEANYKMSDSGKRVLAFAMKECPDDLTQIGLDDEYGYTFVGLVSMIDPPREESKQAVADARGAGIKPIMITGDHRITASAIATQIGIMQDGDLALEGLELEAMSDADLDIILPKVSVYARVSPEHKIRIVDAWQRRGHIVSMTGDGVNDAPALKKAEIGVAMGITGTEVSKDAADMILTDDNFATIVKSVANGRNVYNNIRNAIAFLLSGNLAAIICILIASIAGWVRPFEAVQLLFINLLTDSLPAIAIGMEPAGKDLLLCPPRNPKQPILNGQLLGLICVQGVIIGAFTLGSFLLGKSVDPATATTMAFLTLTLARLFHGFNSRGRASIFKLGFNTNWYSLAAWGAGVLLVVAVTFIPGLNTLFAVNKLSAANYGFVLLFAIAPTILIQSVKVGVDTYEKFSGKRCKIGF